MTSYILTKDRIEILLQLSQNALTQNVNSVYDSVMIVTVTFPHSLYLSDRVIHKLHKSNYLTTITMDG